MSVKRLLSSLQKLYPPFIAESWDNTGLLIPTTRVSASKILLTIDLTTKVVDEALHKNCDFIIAYHPFIFKGIKSIDMANPQHQSLMKLIKQDIGVYCPHTAIDGVQGGVNDWLIDCALDEEYKGSREIINKNAQDPEVGCGRIVQGVNIDLETVIANLKKNLGVDNLLVSTMSYNKTIKSLAICAGSGSGVFAGLKQDIDLYITGELSHHEALYLREQGKSVICANHSNTERGYLAVIQKDVGKEGFEAFISEEDRDPFDFR